MKFYKNKFKIGDLDIRNLWKKNSDKMRESQEILLKFRSILKKFVEVVAFLEVFIEKQDKSKKLHENNFYQIALVLATIRLFIKIFLAACLQSKTTKV